jgi:predicted nucleic acid-binding protein
VIQWHEPAQQALTDILGQRSILITTSYVLLECGNTVARTDLRAEVTRLRMTLAQQGQLIDPTEADLTAAWDAFDQGKPGEAGIVDLVSFAAMRRLGITQAFTNDRHFTAAGFEVLF